MPYPSSGTPDSSPLRIVLSPTITQGDFAEVVRTLHAVERYDWESYLLDKLNITEAGTLLAGIERGGYRLVFCKTDSAFGCQADAAAEAESLRFSLGLAVSAEGLVKEVIWESPAFDAGLTSGCVLLSVNGRSFSVDEPKKAVVRAEDRSPPIELMRKRGKHHALVTLRYREGLRYPQLEPIPDARRRLDAIFAAK